MITNMAYASNARVVFVSCGEFPTGDGDDQPVLSRLADAGICATWSPWDSRDVFTAADLVVLRATWDYTRRHTEFVTWCEAVPRLANPADVVRWNTNKTYLAQLSADGAPVVPTEIARPGESPNWPDREFVLKPAVGAGSRGAARFAVDQLVGARRHLNTLHDAGLDVVVQPYQEGVDRDGETALVFFAGQYSHAFAKRALLPTERRTGPSVDDSALYAPEGLDSTEPDADQLDAAYKVLHAACARLERTPGELLYARVDLVRGADGQPLLLELELTEPSLGFRQADQAAASRFAEAIRAAL